MKVLDENGSFVLRYSNVSVNISKINIDLHDLPSGLYFIQINQTGSSETFKVIKQ